MAFLRAFGAYLPPEIVTNDDIAARTGKNAAAIERATGIRDRRYAAADVSVLDLGEAAAKVCIANAGIPLEDIGLILFSTGSTDRSFPGPASSLAARLGLTTTPVIDLPIASAGSLVAIALAADLAARYGNILIVASEIMSRRVTYDDPDTAIRACTTENSRSSVFTGASLADHWGTGVGDFGSPGGSPLRSSRAIATWLAKSDNCTVMRAREIGSSATARQ